MKNSNELFLDIGMTLATIPGEDYSSGKVKRAAMDMIDAVLDEELDQPVQCRIDGVQIKMPARELIKRSYKIEANAVRVRLALNPRAKPEALVAFAKQVTDTQENHWLMRGFNKFLRLLSKNADEFLLETYHAEIEDLVEKYSYSIVQTAFQRCTVAAHLKLTPLANKR